MISQPAVNFHGKPAEVDAGLQATRIWTDRRVTVAEVELEAGGHVFTATGSARRSPQDAYDANTGALLATTRAVQRLLGLMQKEAAKIK